VTYIYNGSEANEGRGRIGGSWRSIERLHRATTVVIFPRIPRRASAAEKSCFSSFLVESDYE